MSNIGSPHDVGENQPRSVSPHSITHTSRSSSPGISALDGTPRYLFTYSIPPRARSTPPTPRDMAVKPHDQPEDVQQPNSITSAPNGPYQNITKIAPEVPTLASRDLENATQNDVPRSLPSFSEITQTLRLERYNNSCSSQIQRQVHRANAVTARTHRLLHTSRSVLRTLGECIRSEDKQSFVNLFNSFQDALSDYTGLLDEPSDHEYSDSEGSVVYPASFLDLLPDVSRLAILDFIGKVKHDGDFLADRLSNLTHKELIALLPERGLSKSGDSIFGSSPRSSSRMSRNMGYVVDGQTELLSSHQFAGPLDTLIHCARDTSFQGLHMDVVATDVWSTVCARLISNQKPGSEKIVPSVIEAWASSSAWPGKARLELWILQTLQNGQFLLERSKKQSFSLRMQTKQSLSVDDETRRESFYADAVKSLFQLFADENGASVIPEGSRKMCQAIYRKLKYAPGHQTAFPNFATTRWLFPCFLIDAIVVPEIHGLLTDYYISDGARQVILREIAYRSQKSVFDLVYSWKSAMTMNPQTTQIVQDVIDLFQSQHITDAEALRATNVDQSSSSNDTIPMTISATDLNTLINALYPSRRSEYFSDRDPSQYSLQSSASSLSGFSLFQKPGSSDYVPESGFMSTPRASFSTDAESSTLPFIDQTPGSSATPFALQSTLESEQLREASTIIDDILNSRYPPGVDQWCILTADSDGTVSSTIRQRITEAAGTGIAPTSQSIKSNLPINQAVCKDVIEELLLEGQLKSGCDSWNLHGDDRSRCSELHKWLLHAAEQRTCDFEEKSDFVTAHNWYRKVQDLHALAPSTADSSTLSSILQDIFDRGQRSLGVAASVVNYCESLLRSIKRTLGKCSEQLSHRIAVARHLRDKMWYIADVRTSASYDDARSIASALKGMTNPMKAEGNRQAPPLPRWNGSKSNTTNYHLKTEAQILELLTAPAGYGGLSKLSDDQSRGLAAWMDRNVIQNFCRGEERLHKLCMEIRKAVDYLTAEGSSARSSSLFSRDTVVTGQNSLCRSANPWSSIHGMARRLDQLALRTNVPKSLDGISSGLPNPLSASSSRDHLESRSPTLTSKSSTVFWSPVMTEAQSPSSATSIGSSNTQAAPGGQTWKQMYAGRSTEEHTSDQLRQHAISLFLSDLASPLFGGGSETDRAFWCGLGNELTEKHLGALYPVFALHRTDDFSPKGFNFDKAFQQLTLQFSLSNNPYVKLALLHEMDTLLGPYMTEQDPVSPASRSQLQNRSISTLDPQLQSTTPVVDKKVEGFRRLFCNNSFRPHSIFRDMQYIASLVPLSAVESTPQWKAFRNAAVAIVSLKQEVLSIMVETADGIIAHHSNNRGHGRSPSTAQQERDSAAFSMPSRTPSAEHVSRYRMEDAAHLLQITAKEGGAAAQRELATLYLTHPELMDLVIAPFSRPRDVFKDELESKWKRNQDPTRCDPITMCVAHHWMTLSSKGGDALAKEFLRQREEMERLP